MPDFLHLCLFGHLKVHRAGVPITAFRSRQTRRMLGFLALQNGAETPFELLAVRLWPVSETENPTIADKRVLGNVRQSVSNLVGLLGSDRLRKVGRSAVRLVLDDAWIDVAAFDAAISEGTPAALDQAVRLYTGDLMEECLAPWIEPARHSRRQAHQAALRLLAEEAEARLDYRKAEDYLRRLVASDWRKEAPRYALMLLLAHQKEYHAALGVYEDFRSRLSNPRLIPGREIEGLYQRIREKVLRVDTPDERIATPTYRLPRPLIEPVGREAELAEIHARIHFTRFVTLKGPPGVGKTRLALQAAWTAREDYPDGVALVDLNNVTDPAGLCAEIATVLGVAMPPPHGEVALLNFLRPRRMLLVLDNCDRIAGHGDTLLRKLLHECPSLHLLTTSRIAWRADLGERVFAVTPLRTPPGTLRHRSPEELVTLLPEYAAIRLFLETASNVAPDFALTPQNASTIAQLCRSLDGLPLAIQLMAGWASTLSPHEMLTSVTAGLDQIRTADGRKAPRYPTLHAAIEVSYGQLGAGPQCLFRRLALFEGGWTHEAAGAVSDERRTQEHLHLLQEHSLIFSETDMPARRFRMLETLHQFARRKLAETTDAEFLRPKLLDHYLTLAETLQPMLNGSQQESALERLERERGNLRLALTTACDLGEGAKGLRLAGALWKFWLVCGHNAEGSQWLKRLLEEFPNVEPSVRSRALAGAGALANQRADYGAAESFYRERLAIEQAAGNRHLVAVTLGSLGNVASFVNDLAHARDLYEQSLEHFRALGAHRNIALTQSNLAVIASQEGDSHLAVRYNRECIPVLRELQDTRALLTALQNIAVNHRDLGNEAEAMEALQESLALGLRLNDMETLSLGLLLAAYLLVPHNRMEEAAVLVGASDALRERAGLPTFPRSAAEREEQCTLIAQRLGNAVFEEAIGCGRRLSAAEAVAYATTPRSPAHIPLPDRC